MDAENVSHAHTHTHKYFVAPKAISLHEYENGWIKLN